MSRELTKIERQFLALARMQLVKGFRHPKHLDNWLNKYADIITGLPDEERDKILLLYANAGWDGWGKGAARG